MDAFLGYLFFFGLIGGIAWLGYYSWKKNEERKAAFAAFAAEAGLSYYPDGLSASLEGGFWANFLADGTDSAHGRFLSRFAGFEPFGQGHSPAVKNLVFGRMDDLDWAIFDYSYKVTTSNGKSTTTTTYPFSVVVSRMPVMMPKMSMRPENFLHRIGARLGMQDLQFELEEFNRKYVVRSEEPRATYDLLHPQAIEFLMRRPAQFWQMLGFQIMLVESGHRDLPTYLNMMQDIEGFYGLLPGYVREDRQVAAHFEGPF